jgi:hypothetical protein
MKTTLMHVMQALYASEINCSVSSFWDGGWLVQLGDYMNGYKAEQTFDDDKLEDAADWLIEEGKRAFPDSDFSKAFGSALR